VEEVAVVVGVVWVGRLGVWVLILGCFVEEIVSVMLGFWFACFELRVLCSEACGVFIERCAGKIEAEFGVNFGEGKGLGGLVVDQDWRCGGLLGSFIVVAFVIRGIDYGEFVALG
jgi:hypothetical protein